MRAEGFFVLPTARYAKQAEIICAWPRRHHHIELSLHPDFYLCPCHIEKESGT